MEQNANAAQEGNRLMASQLLQEMKFGVEIECVIPEGAMYDNGWSVGSYRDGAPIPEWEGWRSKYDSTVQPSRIQRRDGCVGVEVMSPPLSGADGVTEIQAMVAKIKSMGGKVNNSCGLHINISHSKLFKVARIRRLIRLVARYENALWAMNGSVTRRNNNRHGVSVGGLRGWAKSIKTSYKAHGYDNLQSLGDLVTYHHERYHVLNLLHVTSRNRSSRRVEFRVFAPTLNVAKMTAYLRVVMALVEVAITSSSSPEWDMVKVGRDVHWPDGTYALRKLFYGPLRWYHSRPDLGPTQSADSDPRHKALGILGDDAANELDKSARVLFKMARKFDEQDGWADFPRVARHYVNF